MTWAQRLKRVFNIDIETCQACGGAVRIIASIEDPEVIEKILTHLKEVAGTINMSNPIEFTIKELAYTVLKIVGGNSKLVFKPSPQDDPKQRQPNITVAIVTLARESQVKLKAGLVKTVSYFTRFLAL